MSLGLDGRDDDVLLSIKNVELMSLRERTEYDSINCYCLLPQGDDLGTKAISFLSRRTVKLLEECKKWIVQ